MPKHNISHADPCFNGNSGYAAGIAHWERDGQPHTPFYQFSWDDVAPYNADDDALKAAGTITGAGTLTLAGTFVTSGVATMDIPRNITITPAATLAATGSLTFYGTDYYGEAIAEHIPIASTTVASQGNKAFKTVTAAVALGTVTIGVSIGSGNKFGLPFALDGIWGIQSFYADTTEELSSATVVPRVTTDPATATTGDVRGTIVPNTTPDGSVIFRVTFTAAGRDTRNNLYGVAQYSG